MSLFTEAEQCSASTNLESPIFNYISKPLQCAKLIKLLPNKSIKELLINLIDSDTGNRVFAFSSLVAGSKAGD